MTRQVVTIPVTAEKLEVTSLLTVSTELRMEEKPVNLPVSHRLNEEAAAIKAPPIIAHTISLEESSMVTTSPQFHLKSVSKYTETTTILVFVRSSKSVSQQIRNNRSCRSNLWFLDNKIAKVFFFTDLRSLGFHQCIAPLYDNCYVQIINNVMQNTK